MSIEAGYSEIDKQSYQKYALKKSIDDIPSNELKQGLAAYLKDHRPEGTNFPQILWKKVEHIVESDNPKGKFGDLEDSTRAEIVEEAISKGYFRSFKLEEPWHPEIFLDPEEPTTHPFQHSSIVAYRGTNRKVFFNQENSPEEGETRHPESILNTGYINPGIRKGSGQTDAHGKGGVWMGFLRVATRWAEKERDREIGDPVIFELQIPTTADLKLVISEDGTKEYSNLRALSRDYRPEDLRELAVASIEQGEQSGGSYRGKINFRYDGKVPLKWIRRVWDNEFFRKEENFVSFETYIEELKSSMPEKIPGSAKSVSAPEEEAREEIKEIKKEIKKLENPIESIQRVQLASSKIQWKVESISEYLENVTRRKIHKTLEEASQKRQELDFPQENSTVKRAIKLEEFEEEIRLYNANLEHLHDELEQISSQEIDKQSIKDIELLQNPEEARQLEDVSETLLNEFKSSLFKLKKHAQKNDWNRKEISLEEKFENAMEEKIASHVSNLPFIEKDISNAVHEN